MAANKSTNATSALIRITTEMLKAYAEEVQLAKETMNAVPPAINCDELYDLIQAAQKVFTENCPGP